MKPDTRDDAVPEAELRIPLVEEIAHVSARERLSGIVRVSTVTETDEAEVERDLERDDVDVKRVPIGRWIADSEPFPDVRTEGDVTILPVVEEVLVVERRLRLVEEVRITRRTSTQKVQVPIRLRSQRVIIERAGPDGVFAQHNPENMEPNMTEQTLVGYFDTRQQAEAARDDLVIAGIGATAARILPEEDTSYTRSGVDASYDHRRDEGGFWASLRDLFLPEEDRYAYAEGMSRGGVTLSLSVDDAEYARAAEILERNGSMDVDELETEWKNTGWRGYSAEGAGAVDHSATARAVETGDTVIPIVEEQLRVGKRQVDKGRVRIRSYAVETPVEETVNLRSERVFVERRPVDRALDGPEKAFTDRVIEAEEHAEEAVVSKEARVREEIALRREAEERTETVSDTVRHTEVEIEDDRTEAERLDTDRAFASKPFPH